jgi:hypothetical protein
MARQPVSAEAWERGRAMWEADDKVSYADVGESLGISKQAVAQKAKDQKRQRRMNLPKVVNKAHQAADRATSSSGLPLANFAPAESGQAPGVDADPLKNSPGSEPAPLPIDTTGMSPEQAAEQLAIQKRAEVLTRHRNELNGVRTLIYSAIREKDHDTGFYMGMRAKILSEALSIVQTAERKAWGLDKADETPPVVILERE